MSISGRIETVSFHGILQLLCKEDKTGILRVRDIDGNEYQFFLLDGNVLYAIEAFKEARLGTMLVHDGVITDTIIERCVDKAKQLKVAMGKVLVDDGYISPQLMEHYHYKQILEILTRVIHWEEGEFSYHDQRFNLNWLVVLKFNTLQLLMDATHRIDEQTLARVNACS